MINSQIETAKSNKSSSSPPSSHHQFWSRLFPRADSNLLFYVTQLHRVILGSIDCCCRRYSNYDNLISIVKSLSDYREIFNSKVIIWISRIHSQVLFNCPSILSAPNHWIQHDHCYRHPQFTLIIGLLFISSFVVTSPIIIETKEFPQTSQ